MGRLGHILGSQSLICEAHVHHCRRVTFCGGQIYQPTLAQQVYFPPVAHEVLVHEWPDRGFAVSQFFHCLDVDFDVEVAAVGD